MMQKRAGCCPPLLLHRSGRERCIAFAANDLVLRLGRCRQPIARGGRLSLELHCSSVKPMGTGK